MVCRGGPMGYLCGTDLCWFSPGTWGTKFHWGTPRGDPHWEGCITPRIPCFLGRVGLGYGGEGLVQGPWVLGVGLGCVRKKEPTKRIPVRRGGTCVGFHTLTQKQPSYLSRTSDLIPMYHVLSLSLLFLSSYPVPRLVKVYRRKNVLRVSSGS